MSPKSQKPKTEVSPLASRHFTSDGADPYAEITGRSRTARIGPAEAPIFEQAT